VEPPEKPTLIYDGNCGVCNRAVAWLRANVPEEHLELLPCQNPRRAADFPEVSEAACMEAVQLVMPDRTLYSAEQAIPPVLRLTRRWGWVGILFQLPGASLLTPFVYSWIARNRYAISAFLPGGHGNGTSCETDACRR
jgi:predicted DCC family thiol-disulfide oxidoreductase YuxK